MKNPSLARIRIRPARWLRTTVTALALALALVTCADYTAFAATGHSFVLGKLNKASTATSLKRTTAGPALQLRTTSSSAAPLAVNGTGKVANLNADSVDGYDASDLRTASYSWSHVMVAANVSNQVVPLAPGTYLIGYDAYMPNAGAAGGAVGCFVGRVRGGLWTHFVETRQSTVADETVSISGSGLVTVAPGDVVHWYCYAPAAFSTVADEPLHIFAVRTTPSSDSSLRVAPSSVRLAH